MQASVAWSAVQFASTTTLTTSYAERRGRDRPTHQDRRPAMSQQLKRDHTKLWEYAYRQRSYGSAQRG